MKKKEPTQPVAQSQPTNETTKGKLTSGDGATYNLGTNYLRNETTVSVSGNGATFGRIF